MLFLLFYSFQPRRKRSFSHFLLFSRGGNDIFVVFYSSAMAETQFFGIFSLSSMDDGRFSMFFALRRPTMSIFCNFCISSADDGHFLSFFAFRRLTTGVFSQFLYFVGRRQAFFIVFRVSSADDERFFAISVFRRLTTGGFLSFFAFRRPTTSIFSRFLYFAGRRWVFFYRFHVSGRPEELLFRFFELRDSPKACFPKF